MTRDEPSGRHTSPVPPAGWRGWLSGILTGAAGGMGINVLSTDLGYRGVAITAAVGAILAGAVQLRRLPERAPLRTAVSRLAIAAAVACTVVAVAVPGWTGQVVLAAALLTLTGTVLPSDPVTALRTLAGVALIGVGVALIGVGAAVVAGRDTLAGGALIGIGVAFIGVGAAVVAGGDTLKGGVLIGVGVAAAAGTDTLADVAFIGVGVALIGGGPPPWLAGTPCSVSRSSAPGSRASAPGSWAWGRPASGRRCGPYGCGGSVPLQVRVPQYRSRSPATRRLTLPSTSRRPRGRGLRRRRQNRRRRST